MYKDISIHYTLYKRKDTNKWGYYYYDENNKRHYRSTGREKKKDAIEYIASLLREGSIQPGKNTNITFSEYAKNFYTDSSHCPILKEQERTGRTVAITTKNVYRDKLLKKLLPYFGKYKVKAIDGTLIKKYENEEKDKGISGRTINGDVMLLSMILDQARRDKIISSNPTKDVDRMKEEESKRRAFTLEEVNKICSSDWDNELCKMAFMLSCLTGMRIGEVIALKVKSLKEDYIEVSENYSSILNLSKSTKNGKTRTVPYPEILRKPLERLKEGRGEEDYIFSYRGDVPLEAGTIRKNLRRVMEKVGINDNALSFHSCRYFFDSYLYLKAEVDREKVMKVMGHQGVDMFRHYLDIQKDDLDDVREAQGQIIDNVLDNVKIKDF